MSATALMFRSMALSCGINNPRMLAFLEKLADSNWSLSQYDSPPASDGVQRITASGVINGKPFTFAVTFPEDLLDSPKAGA